MPSSSNRKVSKSTTKKQKSNTTSRISIKKINLEVLRVKVVVSRSPKVEDHTTTLKGKSSKSMKRNFRIIDVKKNKKRVTIL